MDKGVIGVAKRDGLAAIKMSGDVRLTLSLRFDAFIDDMLADESIKAVVFDLSDAEAIDSTSLGLMAKIALKGRALGYEDPLALSPNPTIRRSLDTMGFAEILKIVDAAQIAACEYSALQDLGVDSDSVENQFKRKVLDAHRCLIELNAANKDEFDELIQSLERFD